MRSFKKIMNKFLFESFENKNYLNSDDDDYIDSNSDAEDVLDPNADDYLDKKYAADIKLKKRESKFSPGWRDLDIIISELTAISAKNAVSISKINIGDFLLSKGYNLLGSGAYRDVYSIGDYPWVIKVDKSLKGNYNTRELNIYFYKKMGTSTLGLYPKIYGWDNTKNKLPDKLIKDDPSEVRWIIFEKVVPIKDVQTLKMIFNRFYTDFDKYLNELIKIGLAEISIFDYINTDPEYENASGYSESDVIAMNWWKLIYDTLLQLKKFKNVSATNNKKHFTDPSFYTLSQKENEMFFSKGKVNDTSINASFLKILFKFIHMAYIEVDIPVKKFLDTSFKICDDLGIFKTFSPDVAYIYKDFANDMWEDMHIKNLGYKPAVLKNSKSPWEALAFLDFAEDY
jgi:hypothetical protein